MPRSGEIVRRATPYGELSTQSLSDYLATVGLFLTLCIAGMATFVCVRVIEANFPGTPHFTYWLLGVGVFIFAYFAYGRIKLAPLLMPVLFIALLWLCREVVSKPVIKSHSHAQASHSSAKRGE